MYRPTVRYDDVYKEYVDKLFQATSLDRSQIIRMGLFLLGHTSEGKALLKAHLKKDVPLPSPAWGPDDHGAWRTQTWVRERGGGGRHITTERRERPIYSSNGKGAITFHLDG